MGDELIVQFDGVSNKRMGFAISNDTTPHDA
jgi:hypothetical protein